MKKNKTKLQLNEFTQTPWSGAKAVPEKNCRVMPKTDFQSNSKQKCLIINLVSNSHQKGSEAVYTNIYNRIIKSNNSSNNHNNNKKNTLCRGLWWLK